MSDQIKRRIRATYVPDWWLFVLYNIPNCTTTTSILVPSIANTRLQARPEEPYTGRRTQICRYLANGQYPAPEGFPMFINRPTVKKS